MDPGSSSRSVGSGSLYLGRTSSVRINSNWAARWATCHITNCGPPGFAGSRHCRWYTREVYSQQYAKNNTNYTPILCMILIPYPRTTSCLESRTVDFPWLTFGLRPFMHCEAQAWSASTISVWYVRQAADRCSASPPSRVNASRWMENGVNCRHAWTFFSGEDMHRPLNVRFSYVSKSTII
jgi:hypothetical protein